MPPTQPPTNIVQGLRMLRAAQLCAENGEYGGAVKACQRAREWFQLAVLQVGNELRGLPAVEETDR